MHPRAELPSCRRPHRPAATDTWTTNSVHRPTPTLRKQRAQEVCNHPIRYTVHMLSTRIGGEDPAGSRGEALGEWPGSVAAEEILLAIHAIRSHRVMLDADLVALCGVETKAVQSGCEEQHRTLPRGLRVPVDGCRALQLEVTDCDLKLGRSQIPAVRVH